MSDPVILAIIGLAGGAGGLFTLIKSWLDYRANKSARVEDADERLVSRLEARLDKAEQRIAVLEDQIHKDDDYIMSLSSTIIKAGLDLPDRQ